MPFLIPQSQAISLCTPQQKTGEHLWTEGAEESRGTILKTGGWCESLHTEGQTSSSISPLSFQEAGSKAFILQPGYWKIFSLGKLVDPKDDIKVVMWSVQNNPFRSPHIKAIVTTPVLKRQPGFPENYTLETETQTSKPKINLKKTKTMWGYKNCT